MREIHPTAIVDRRAELADNVVVGAYTIIKAGVQVAEGTVIQEHCHVHGNAIIGKRCKIGPAAFVGLPPQHLKHDGANTRIIIGDDVIIREMASLHRSINPAPEHATRVGNRCMIMATAHVGHDCVVEDDVIMANGVMLGGHATIGAKAFIGGGTTIHQFVRIGRLAILSGNEATSQDVPPFGAVRYRGLKGYNAIGCKRAGMSRQTIHAVRSAFRCLHTNRHMAVAIEAIRTNLPQLPEIQELLAFLESSRRGILGSLRAQGISRFGRRAISDTMDSDE